MSRTETTDTTVLGCGVVGLSCAVRLLEDGHRVTLVTREKSANTTSAVAAALWYPFLVGPLDRVLRWSVSTLERLYDLALDPASGVSIGRLVALHASASGEPFWKPAVRSFRRAAPAELPPHRRHGFVAEAPRIDTSLYLPYLESRLLALGGQIEHLPEGVARVEDLAGRGRLIVNCPGLEARSLVDDTAVYPVRGQVVRVRNPGLDLALFDVADAESPGYVVPRRRDCILGGTADAHEWDRTPSEADTQDILRRCMRLEPRLDGAQVLDVHVGLRPARDEVRLELDHLPDGTAVIHHYGHGGAGFTLSWGCAEDVSRLARHVLSDGG